MTRVTCFIAESCSYEFVTQCKLYPSDPYTYLLVAPLVSAHKVCIQACTEYTLQKAQLILALGAKSKGRVRLPNRMNFRKNSKRPLTPPLIFGKFCCKFFIMDMVAYMQGV